MSVTSRLAGRALRLATAATALGAVLFAVLPSGVAPAATTTTTVWGTQAPQAVRLSPDTRAVELGTRFTPKVNGSATAIRFYKQAGAKGKHVATLWSSAGKKLASVTFKNETASGWQTAKLSKAVKLSAGKTYVVSYHVPKNGRYALTTNFHGASVASTLSVASSNAGVYAYSSKVKFPKSTRTSNQYWVDVTFKSTAPVTAPKPSPTTPAPTTPAPTTPAPTTPAPTTPAPTTPAPTTSTPITGFPTEANTGVPAGWSPTRSITGDYTVTTEGAVVENLRITNGVLYVRARNVTIRNVELVGARIVNDYARVCYNGLRIENTTILRGNSTSDMPVVESGGYTAIRVKVKGTAEGFRAGERTSGCGPVVIQDSWIRVDPPTGCSNSDSWHGDGLQGYQGPEVTIKNTYIALTKGNNCLGTSPLFYPNQGNTRLTVDNVLLYGGGYSFRSGTPGSVKGLKVISGSYQWGPVDVEDCRQLTWGAGNEVVALNSDGSLRKVSDLACQTR